MAKYIAKDRLKLAISNLADFARRVQKQRVQHVLPVLALKERGVGPGQEAPFEESDDFEFWDSYFLVDPVSEDGRYYDPLQGLRRIATHPHSNVATMRKGTFEDSWHAGSSRVDDGTTYWKLAIDYTHTVREKSLTKGGSTELVPVFDLIAWLRRHDEFPDTSSMQDLLDDFIGQFHLSAAEFDGLFVVGGENEATFFGSTPVSEIEVLQLVGDPVGGRNAPIGGPMPSFEPDPASIGSDLALPYGVVAQAATALGLGSHVVFAGPPGTGKSTLAELLANEATRANYAAGYLTTTATSDWTTFDTIGGYMPTGVGNEIEFREGLILRSIREDSWCIIDELNRANIDRAIGAMITLLAGSEETAIVELPFRHEVTGGSGVRLEPVRVRRDTSQERSSRDPDSGDYVIGRNWRLIATMNTFDRNNLFPLTAAFARRFATVIVGIPASSDALDKLAIPAGLSRNTLEILLSETARSQPNPLPLGPAIIKDCWRFIDRCLQQSGTTGDETEMDAAMDALALYVLPQFSGLERSEWELIRDLLAEELIKWAQTGDQADLRMDVKRKLDHALRQIQGDR